MAGYKALFFEMTAHVFLKKMSINYTTHNEGIIDIVHIRMYEGVVKRFITDHVSISEGTMFRNN